MFVGEQSITAAVPKHNKALLWNWVVWRAPRREGKLSAVFLRDLPRAGKEKPKWSQVGVHVTRHLSCRVSPQFTSCQMRWLVVLVVCCALLSQLVLFTSAADAIGDLSEGSSQVGSHMLCTGSPGRLGHRFSSRNCLSQPSQESSGPPFEALRRAGSGGQCWGRSPPYSVRQAPNLPLCSSSMRR